MNAGSAAAAARPGRALLAVALLAAALIARAATPVAFVADVKGDATLEGANRLAFLAELAPGARLTLAAGAVATIVFAESGAEFAAKGPGEFVVEAAGLKAAKGPAPARRQMAATASPAVVARVSQSATASLRMRGVTPAPAVKPGPAYPVDASIATLQPVLRWNGDPAIEYRVSVIAADGREAWKGSARANSIRVAAKLAPAARYTWNISVGGRSSAEAYFETLPAAAIAKAEKSRSGARGFSDRVLHAFVLQDLGAAQDAREAWAALARERPDLPELAVLAR